MMKREIMKVGYLTKKIYEECVADNQLDCFDEGYNYDQHFYDMKLAKNENTSSEILDKLLEGRLDDGGNAVVYWVCRNQNTSAETLEKISISSCLKNDTFRWILSHKNCSLKIEEIIGKKFKIV